MKKRTSYLKCGIKNYYIGNFMTLNLDDQYLCVIDRIEVNENNPDEGTIYLVEANFYQWLKCKKDYAKLWLKHEFPRNWEDVKYLYRRHIGWRFQKRK